MQMEVFPVPELHFEVVNVPADLCSPLKKWRKMLTELVFLRETGRKV